MRTVPERTFLRYSSSTVVVCVGYLFTYTLPITVPISPVNDTSLQDKEELN